MSRLPKARRIVVFVGLVTAFLLLPAASAMGSAGTMIVTTDTTLTEDHYGSIVIEADNVTLDCAGYQVIGPGDPIYGNDGIRASARDGITIQNCRVTGFRGGIRMSLVSNGLVRDNSLFGNNLGVYLFSFPDTPGTDVVNNEAANNSSHGFHFESSNSLISANTASSNGGSGFNTGIYAAHNTFDGNVARWNDGDGFRSGSTITGSTFLGNVADTNSGSGFSTHESADANTLVGNSAVDNAVSGFVLRTAGNVLADNTASSNGVDGFELNNSTGNQLTGNYAADNPRKGFLLWEAGENELSGNSAVANGEEGFFIATNDLASPASMNTLAGNTAAHNGSSGFTFVHSSGNTLTGNTSEDNGSYGYLVNTWLELGASDNRFEGNTARHNGADGFALFGEPAANNYYAENRSQGNAWSGFVVGSSDYTTVSNNHILQNGSHGIAVWSGSNHTISDNQIVSNGWGEGGGGLIIGDGSHTNTVSGNVSSSNAHNGLAIVDAGSELNEVTDNEARLNGHNGFVIWIADNNRMTGNVAADNGHSGFAVAGNFDTGDRAMGNVLIGNSATGQDAADPDVAFGTGFHLGFASTNTFEANQAARNYHGFQMWKADENTFFNNVADRNVVGFDMGDSHDNEFTSNTASHNSDRSGFELSGGSSGNVFMYNTASKNNSWAGFAVYDGIGNEFIENTAVNNKWGFVVWEPSTDNLFTMNYGRNAWLDQWDLTDETANNEWKDNDFKWIQGDGGWR